jgi:hypothetical protein
MQLIPTEATPTIALASLVVAVCAAGVALAALRKGGPAVKVQCNVVTPDPDTAALELEVINTGRGDTTIDVERLNVEWMYNDRRSHMDVFSPQFDKALPLRLSGNSSIKLTAPATRLLVYRERYTLSYSLHMKVGGRNRSVRISLPKEAPDETPPPPHTLLT